MKSKGGCSGGTPWKKRKRGATLVVAFLLSAVSVTPVLAAPEWKEQLTLEGNLQLTATYDSKDAAEQVEVPETYLLEEKEYVLIENGVTYQELKTTPETKKETVMQKETTELLDEKKVAPKLTYKTVHETLTLPLKEVEYQEVLDETQTDTVEESVEHGFSIARPEIANSRSVTYTDKNAGERTVEVPLVDVTSSEAYWKDGYDMTANYTGDKDVRFWQMGDIQIPNTGNTPVYSGYEAAILDTLGLSTKEVKINSSRWGGVSNENGQRVQAATFAVSRYGNDYLATYRMQVPRVKYTAHAVYELPNAKLLTGDTIYTLQMTAQYAPLQKGLSPLAVAGIVFGALVLIATVVIILFILAKKRKEKEEQQQIN